MGAKHWMANAFNPDNRGKATRYVTRHYGRKGFTTSPITGERIIATWVLEDMRTSPNPHVRGMAEAALNTPARKRIREAMGRGRRHRA